MHQLLLVYVVINLTHRFILRNWRWGVTGLAQIYSHIWTEFAFPNRIQNLNRQEAVCTISWRFSTS